MLRRLKRFSIFLTEAIEGVNKLRSNSGTVQERGKGGSPRGSTRGCPLAPLSPLLHRPRICSTFCSKRSREASVNINHFCCSRGGARDIRHWWFVVLTTLVS